MPRHRLLWLDLAERQYLDLPSQLLDLVDAYLAQLGDNPTRPTGGLQRPLRPLEPPDR